MKIATLVSLFALSDLSDAKSSAKHSAKDSGDNYKCTKDANSCTFDFC